VLESHSRGVNRQSRTGLIFCRGCSNPVSSAGCTSVDIGASANPELVDKFCYLGEMLSVDGGADAAAEAGI